MSSIPFRGVQPKTTEEAQVLIAVAAQHIANELKQITAELVTMNKNLKDTATALSRR